MKVLVIVGICVFVLQVDARCGFYVEQRDCADQHGMAEYDIHSIYTRRKPNQLRVSYTGCVWRKMGFQKHNGDISYEKITSASGALLVIARICDDMANSNYYPDFLSAAVGICKDSPLPREVSRDQMAENARRCIEAHIKMLIFATKFNTLNEV